MLLLTDENALKEELDAAEERFLLHCQNERLRIEQGLPTDTERYLNGKEITD